ncbi:hypothetical protein C8Q73DRAFT_663518 [Cubamyces lactineus]|nr:hypothetical protein C8Q73DRAFT_663518 [Cubamyces lactineus]
MSYSDSHPGYGSQESFYSAEIHAETVFPTTFGYADGYHFEDWYLASGTFIRNVFSDPQSPPVVDVRHGQLYVRFFPTEHLNTPFGQYYPHTQPMGTDLRFPNGLFNDRSEDAPVVVVPSEVLLESPPMPSLDTPPVERTEREDSEPDFVPPRPEDLDDGPEARFDNARDDSEGARSGPTDEEFARALRMIVEDLAQGEDVDEMCRELRKQKESKEQMKVLIQDPRARHNAQARAGSLSKRADADARVESECAHAKEPESSENTHKGQFKVSVTKAHVTYEENKEGLGEVRGLCDEHDPELYCDCGMTFERAVAFQRECERTWADEEDADVAEDVRAEGSPCPESERDRLEGCNGSPGTAFDREVSARLTYLGESRLAYHRGRRATPFPSVSEAGFEEAGSPYGADVESEASDVEMTETESEHEQEENQDQYEKLKSSQEIVEPMEVEGDDQGDTSSATAASEDEGAKDKRSSSSSSAQASRLGTPTTFGPSTIESYEHDRQKLGEFEGFLHNLLGEAFHEVYEEMCEFFQERLREAHS